MTVADQRANPGRGIEQGTNAIAEPPGVRADRDVPKPEAGDA